MGKNEEYTCVNRVSTNGGMYYAIANSDGVAISYSEDDLKLGMHTNQISIKNLTLTTADRIRYKGTNEEEEKYRQAIKEVRGQIAVAKMLDTLHEIKIKDQVLYLIDIDGNAWREHILYIPEDTFLLEGINSAIKMATGKVLRGKLKIVGGAGIISMTNSFSYCTLEELDLEDFYGANISQVFDPFFHANIVNIKMGHFINRIRNALSIKGMFKGIMTSEIHIEDLTSSSIKAFESIFKDTKARYVQIRNIHLDSLKSIKNMFADAMIENVEITNCTFENKNEPNRIIGNTEGVFKWSRIAHLESDNETINKIKNGEYT